MYATLPTYVGSASYAPCTDCGEGALTWNPVAFESRCRVCDRAD